MCLLFRSTLLLMCTRHLNSLSTAFSIAFHHSSIPYLKNISVISIYLKKLRGRVLLFSYYSLLVFQRFISPKHLCTAISVISHQSNAINPIFLEYQALWIAYDSKLYFVFRTPVFEIGSKIWPIGVSSSKIINGSM